MPDSRQIGRITCKRQKACCARLFDEHRDVPAFSLRADEVVASATVEQDPPARLPSSAPDISALLNSSIRDLLLNRTRNGMPWATVMAPPKAKSRVPFRGGQRAYCLRGPSVSDRWLTERLRDCGRRTRNRAALRAPERKTAPEGPFASNALVAGTFCQSKQYPGCRHSLSIHQYVGAPWQHPLPRASRAAFAPFNRVASGGAKPASGVLPLEDHLGTRHRVTNLIQAKTTPSTRKMIAAPRPGCRTNRRMHRRVSMTTGSGCACSE